jgi:hypothetical protein
MITLETAVEEFRVDEVITIAMDPELSCDITIITVEAAVHSDTIKLVLW